MFVQVRYLADAVVASGYTAGYVNLAQCVEVRRRSNGYVELYMTTGTHHYREIQLDLESSTRVLALLGEPDSLQLAAAADYLDEQGMFPDAVRVLRRGVIP